MKDADYPGLASSEAAKDEVATYVLATKITQPRTGKAVTFTLENATHEAVLTVTAEFRSEEAR